jgi:hypothetical protein
MINALYRKDDSVGARSELDFASLLDDLISASNAIDIEDEAAAAAPSLKFDMLDQIERLQAENVSLFADSVMREYDDQSEPRITVSPPEAEAASLEPALEDLFFLDPDSIARELGIKSKGSLADLDKARRSFALRYHPDRVPEQFRDRAALRMQIANMLIDEAKRARR